MSLTGSSAAQALGNAVSAVVATSLLGPHGRGLMVLGTTIASFTPLLAGMGTGSQLRARLPNVAGDEHRRRLLASYTLWSVLALVAAGALASLLSAVSAPFIDPGLAEPPFLLAVLVATTGYVALTQFPDAWYAAGHFGAGGAWAAAMAAGGLAGMTAAAFVERRAWALLLGQGIGMVAVAAAQAVRLHAVGLFPLRSPGRPELSELLRFGAPALGLTVGLALISRADRYVLGIVAGADAVGVYSLAATLSEAPRMVPASLGQLVNRDIATGSGLSHVRRARRMALMSVLATGVAVAVGGWLAIVPLFGVAFADARPLLLVLLVAELAFAPFAVASRGLLGGGWMGTAGGLGIAGCVAGIALYGVLVPLWGTYGAAYGCLVLYGALSAASWSLLRRRLQSAARRAPGGEPASGDRECLPEGRPAWAHARRNDG